MEVCSQPKQNLMAPLHWDGLTWNHLGETPLGTSWALPERFSRGGKTCSESEMGWDCRLNKRETEYQRSFPSPSHSARMWAVPAPHYHCHKFCWAFSAKVNHEPWIKHTVLWDLMDPFVGHLVTAQVKEWTQLSMVTVQMDMSGGPIWRCWHIHTAYTEVQGSVSPRH